MAKVGRAIACGLGLTAGALGAAAGKQYVDRRWALPKVLPELRHSRLFFPISSSNRFNRWLVAALLSRPSLLPAGVANMKYAVPADIMPSDSSIAQRWNEIFSDYEELRTSVPISEYVPLAGSQGQTLGAAASAELTDPRGVILWFHGGGLIAGHYDYYDDYCGKLAQDTQCALLSVEYRLAPDYPFPYPLLDCVAALIYAHEKACALNVPLIISGVSAGGGLAAATAQVAADLGIPVAFQALVYPMLDSETGKTVQAGIGDFLWTPSANRYGWASYLKDMEYIDDPQVCAYAVPAGRKDFSTLAPAWIGCGDLDLFYDECQKYHEKLQQAGVDSIFYGVTGMYHAADGLAPESQSMRDFYQSMLQAIRAYL